MEELLEANREIKQNLNNGQKSLFSGSTSYNPSVLKLKETNKNIIPLATQLNWEKELLGLYISAHPLDAYKSFLEKKSYPLSALNSDMVGKLVKIGGIIATIKRIITKNGKPMMFMNIEDLTTRVEVVVFAGVIDKNPEIFQENKIVFVKGKVDNRDGEIKIIADEVQEIITQEA